MLRLFSMAMLCVGIALSAFTASAKIPDPGPPYTEEQFLAISQERMPFELRANLPKWWAQAPDYLKKHILTSHSERWPSSIMCNYFGFRPYAAGALNSNKCEEEHYQASQQGKKNWTPDGQ